MKQFFITAAFILAFFLLAGASLAHAKMSCRISSSCGNDEVNVLELSGSSNAHAALPGAGYPYRICCEGAMISASCSGSGAKVFAKLSSEQNAHVRLFTEADYPGSNNACLSVSAGSLSVAYKEDNCKGYDTTVLSLAKVPTNSHAGGPSAYYHKICASYTAPSSSGGGGFIDDAWKWLGLGKKQEAPQTETSAPVIPATSASPASSGSGVSSASNKEIEEDEGEEAFSGPVSNEIFLPPAPERDINLQAAAGSASEGGKGLMMIAGFALAVFMAIWAGRKLYLARK